jgi:hypothetical protein
MPTIRVVDDNVIEFVDSNGDVAAREEYDEAASEVSFVDGDGNPMPVSLGDATAESLNTAQLSDGVAGSGNTITSVDGNSGEYREIGTIPCGQSNLSTTSTSYTTLTGQFTVLDLGQYGPLTNWEDLYVSFHGGIREDSSGETAFFRVYDSENGVAYSATEQTVDGANTGNGISNREALDVANRSTQFKPTIQAKTTGGTAILDNAFIPTLIKLWGKIQ